VAINHAGARCDGPWLGQLKRSSQAACVMPGTNRAALTS
jgi:hypothetical protein